MRAKEKRERTLKTVSGERSGGPAPDPPKPIRPSQADPLTPQRLYDERTRLSRRRLEARVNLSYISHLA